MSLPSGLHSSQDGSDIVCGQGAVLRQDGSPMGAQSSWVPTAAAIASAIHASASPAVIIHGGAHKGGWGSRSAAKEFVDRWFEHAHDMIGASVHVTTREERKAWVSCHNIAAVWVAFSPSGLHSSQDGSNRC